ncbi:hypothetical protein JCM10207_001975 [Rhodosporidiobolus poonsookiae]
MSAHPALVRDNTFVITGAQPGGIGFESAFLLLDRFGLKGVLADVSKDGLEGAREELIKRGVAEDRFTTRVTDVSNSADVDDLAEFAFSTYGKVDFLMLNAGISMPSKSFGGDRESWDKILAVNLHGAINGQQAFVEKMVAQQTPAAVVITGSKQGITNPPGNPAYNASKAAVKSLAEGLAHALLDTPVSAHLLVPGWTWTRLGAGGNAPELDKKPAAAWTGAQVAEELFARLDEFYIICPDNDVTWELDQARMQYNLDDILLKRPALSRWNPAFADSYAKYIEKKLAQ